MARGFNRRRVVDPICRERQPTTGLSGQELEMIWAAHQADLAVEYERLKRRLEFAAALKAEKSLGRSGLTSTSSSSRASTSSTSSHAPAHARDSDARPLPPRRV